MLERCARRGTHVGRGSRRPDRSVAGGVRRPRLLRRWRKASAACLVAVAVALGGCSSAPPAGPPPAPGYAPPPAAAAPLPVPDAAAGHPRRPGPPGLPVPRAPEDRLPARP